MAAHVTPEEVIAPHMEPIAEALAEADSAEQVRFAAEGKFQKAEGRLAAASEAAIAATERVESLRAAGRAALGTIDDFPPIDTFRAQMTIDGKPESFESVTAHLDALNEYARTNNAVIAVVGPMASSAEEKGLLNFIRPNGGEEVEEPPVSIARDDEGRHYLGISSGEAYRLNYALSRFEDLGHQTELEESRTDAPIEEVRFVSTVEGVEEYFREKKQRTLRDALRQEETAVIYGDEAVAKFVELQAWQTERLRPALFGIMGVLEKPYNGPELSDGSEIKDAHEAFYADIERYVEGVAQYGHVSAERGAQEYPLLSKDMQDFIGVEDDEMVGRVQEAIRRQTSVHINDGEVGITTGDALMPKEAWDNTWISLKKKGFGKLVERQAEWLRSEFVARSIESDVLEARLSYSATFGRSERRQLNKALRRTNKWKGIAAQQLFG